VPFVFLLFNALLPLDLVKSTFSHRRDAGATFVGDDDAIDIVLIT
jgi:hypothetical protein